MKDLLLNFLKGTFDSFDSMVADAVAVLADTSGMFSNSWTSMISMSGHLKSFCLVIIGLCVLLEIGKTASKLDNVTWEMGIKLGAKVCLARVCLDVAPKFLRACYAQAQEWILTLGTNGTSMGQKAVEVARPLIEETDGFFVILGLFISTFIVLMAIKICGLLIQIMAYGRMFELAVYVVISPVPCAFFPLGDGSGGGMSRVTSKFLMSFAAVCLQGVMMLVAIKVFEILMSEGIVAMIGAANPGGLDPDEALTNVIYTMLLAAIALVMSIMKCGSWAKGVLDAGG